MDCGISKGFRLARVQEQGTREGAREVGGQIMPELYTHWTRSLNFIPVVKRSDEMERSAGSGREGAAGSCCIAPGEKL